MPARRRYRRRPDSFVVAIQLDLDTSGFTFYKWGSEQRCKRGDWIVDNGKDVHTVDLFFTGLSFGFAIRAGKAWQLQPQVGIMYTPASFNGTLDDGQRRGLAVTQVGLGFVFDL